MVYLGELLDFLVDPETFTWFKDLNNTSQQENFILYIISRTDKFLILMHRAGED